MIPMTHQLTLLLNDPYFIPSLKVFFLIVVILLIIITIGLIFAFRVKDGL